MSSDRRKQGLSVVDLRLLEPEQSALRWLDGEFCREHVCVPLKFERSANLLHVAVSTPEAVTYVQAHVQANVRPYRADEDSIRMAVSRLYPDEHSIRIDIDPELLKQDLDEPEDAKAGRPDWSDSETKRVELPQELAELVQEIERLRAALERTVELLVDKKVCSADEARELISSGGLVSPAPK